MNSYLKIFSILLALIFLATTASAQRPEPIKTVVLGDTLYTLLKPGDIPAIFEPEFITVTEAEKTYYDNERLIVVSDGDETKGSQSGILTNTRLSTTTSTVKQLR